MSMGKQQKRLTIRRSVSEETMSIHDCQAAEALLAKLVARAYAADHPELFQPDVELANDQAGELNQ